MSSRQAGIALPISLIILAVMTIIAISSLRGSNNAERIVSSQQQKLITFEAAESVVLASWDAELIRKAITDRLSNDEPLDTAFDLTLDDIDLELDFDQASTLGEVDLSTELSLQYCGEASIIGGGLNSDESVATPAAMLIEVKGTSSIDSTKSKSVVVRRGKLTSLSAGVAANCASY